jgi:hypothetical protein
VESDHVYKWITIMQIELTQSSIARPWTSTKEHFLVNDRTSVSVSMTWYSLGELQVYETLMVGEHAPWPLSLGNQVYHSLPALQWTGRLPSEQTVDNGLLLQYFTNDDGRYKDLTLPLQLYQHSLDNSQRIDNSKEWTRFKYLEHWFSQLYK